MYPTAVIVVAVALIVLMMLFVLPSFGKIYEGLGAELPYLTQIVMNVSDFFVANWWWMLILSVGIAIAIKISYSRSFAMQKAWDKFMLNMPIFGQIVKKAAIARAPSCLVQFLSPFYKTSRPFVLANLQAKQLQ